MAEETVLTQDPPDNQTTEKPVATVPADWRASLPEDLRGEKMFDNIKGKDANEVLPTLAKGYRDAQKLVGGSLGKLPAKDARPEEVKAWQQSNLPKLREAGLIDAPPEKPDAYTAKFMKDGEVMEASPEMLKDFYSSAFSLGLSDKQAQGMLDLYAMAQTKLGGTVKETMASLEKEFGAGVHVQITRAQRAARKFGGDELIDVLEATGLGNHPALIKAWARAGAVVEEDDPIFKDTVRSNDGDAKTKRDAILNDRKHAYWSRDLPGHKEAVAEVARLNQIIFAQEG